MTKCKFLHVFFINYEHCACVFQRNWFVKHMKMKKTTLVLHTHIVIFIHIVFCILKKLFLLYILDKYFSQWEGIHIKTYCVLSSSVHQTCKKFHIFFTTGFLCPVKSVSYLTTLTQCFVNIFIEHNDTAMLHYNGDDFYSEKQNNHKQPKKDKHKTKSLVLTRRRDLFNSNLSEHQFKSHILYYHVSHRVSGRRISLSYIPSYVYTHVCGKYC